MPCNLDLSSLSERNINDCQFVPLDNDHDGFMPQKSVFDWCVQEQATKDPFAQYCFVPKPTESTSVDVLASNVCSLVNTQTNVPNSIFQRMVRDDFGYLDQFPSIWESMLNPESEEEWITTLPYIHTDKPNGDYLGLGYVSVFPRAMSVSNNATSLLFVSDGQLSELSTFDGTMHLALDADLRQVAGYDDAVQSVNTNSDGFLAATLFSDALYFKTNNVWRLEENTDATNVSQCMKLWETADFTRVAVLSANMTQWMLTVFELTKRSSQQIATFGETLTQAQQDAGLQFRLGILSISSDQTQLIASTFLCPTEFSTMRFHIIDANTLLDPTYNVYSLQAVQFNTVLAANFSTGSDPESRLASVNISQTLCENQFQFLTQFYGLLFQFSLVAGNPIASDVTFKNPNSLVYLTESLDHSLRFIVYNDSIYTSIALDTSAVFANTPFAVNDHTHPYAFAIAPDASDVWIFRPPGGSVVSDMQLYRLYKFGNTPDVGNLWTTNFNVFSAQRARVSDFGDIDELDPNIYVPGSKWFLGTTTTSQDFAQSTVYPIEVARSKHSVFRFVITSVTIILSYEQYATDLPTFAFPTGVLQRANEYVLCQNASSTAVFNDGNVLIGDWKSSTHDQTSHYPELSNSLLFERTPFVAVSPNGLYILYGNRDTRRMRLVYDVFNADRFNEWSVSQDERFGRALDSQSNFCWNELLYPQDMENPFVVQFADFRCSCIGGARLAARAQPQSTMPNAIGVDGPFYQNLPCVLVSCKLGVDTLGDTTTNVAYYADQRCKNRNFAICKDDFESNGGQTTNVVFEQAQNCGMFIEGCKQNSDCDVGSACSLGRCVPKCRTNADCSELFGSTNNMACVDNTCKLVAIIPPTSNFAIVVAVVITSVFVVLLLLLVIFLALKKRRATQTSSTGGVA